MPPSSWTAWLLLPLCACLLGSQRSPAHGLYLSLEEIRYEAPTLQVGFRLFTNDLADALRHETGKAVPVADHWQDPATQAAIMQYLAHHSSLRVDGVRRELRLDHIEPQQETTWVACVLDLPHAPRRLDLQNRLLLELFDTQKNLVRVYRDQEMELFQLDQQQTEVEVVWRK
jgi:hypothetical protein